MAEGGGAFPASNTPLCDPSYPGRGTYIGGAPIVRSPLTDGCGKGVQKGRRRPPPSRRAVDHRGLRESAITLRNTTEDQWPESLLYRDLRTCHFRCSVRFPFPSVTALTTASGHFRFRHDRSWREARFPRATSRVVHPFPWLAAGCRSGRDDRGVHPGRTECGAGRHDPVRRRPTARIVRSGRAAGSRLGAACGACGEAADRGDGSAYGVDVDVREPGWDGHGRLVFGCPSGPPR